MGVTEKELVKALQEPTLNLERNFSHVGIFIPERNFE